MSRKPKILFCGESSYLSSGFAVYTHEVLSRLFASDKYEIAELGAFGSNSDPRSFSVPWKFYGNMPSDNKEEKAIYNADPANRYGKFKFEATCLDFHPDIVINIKDHWGLQFHETSPYRDYYWLSLMPTIDANQKSDWLYTFSHANSVFAYTDWGLDVLRKQMPGATKVLQKALPPAVDYEVFKPLQNKAAFRKQFNLEDKFVVGMVARNQARKLFPDLIQGFSELVRKSDTETAKRLCLYLHTCYPDIGWEIPLLLREHGVSNKVYFTYRCLACGYIFPSLFSDTRTSCIRCREFASVMPNSSFGVSRSDLNLVYNLFDVYVQYANAGGFEIPLLEAAAAGVPTLAVDYAAMSDVVRKVSGEPLKHAGFSRELVTYRYMAIPNNNLLVEHLEKLSKFPQEILAAKGFAGRLAAQSNYDWDKTALGWMEHIDSIPFLEHQHTWKSRPKFHEPAEFPRMPLDNVNFLKYCFIKVAGMPNLLGTNVYLRILRDLNYGMKQISYDLGKNSDLSSETERERWEKFTREHVYEICLGYARDKNYWEEMRAIQLSR